MEQEGQWAEAPEVSAALTVTGRSMHIFDIDTDTIHKLHTDKDDNSTKPILLRLTNSNCPSSAHYDLLLPVDRDGNEDLQSNFKPVTQGDNK